MLVIKVRNVHKALPEALYQLRAGATYSDSRNGKVARLLMPVTTQYTHPRERVLFWPERDANPFFHLYEGLWMLGGRNDVASLTRFVKRMRDFSDNGEIFHGAYGYRWRRHFGIDQLALIGSNLKTNYDCRRQVLQMYDPRADAAPAEVQAEMRDIPCNLTACFQVNDGALDMVVYNRSNDIIWGAYGANAVHFSMLQEYVAAMAGVPVGNYWQVSFNWHAYVAFLRPVFKLADMAAQPPSEGVRTPYEGEVTPYPMVSTDPVTWMQDLLMFLEEEGKAMGYRDPFFRRVALPMMRAHNAFKEGKGRQRFADAISEAGDIRATDWRKAVLEWIARRQHKWEEANG